MMRNLAFIFLIISSCVCAVSANRKIEGRVLFANDSTAVVGASVMMYLGKTMSTGGQTNLKGHFSLALSDKDDVQLKISFVGYKPAVFNIQHGKEGVNFGDIYLSEDTKELEGVEVTAQNYSVDKTLVFPKKQQIKISRDLYSLLETMNLKGLNIDTTEETVDIHGKQVQWQINGQPKTQQEVQHIDPKDIARVEYTDTPSIRYQDKGVGGVINIILKVHTTGGTAWANGSSALSTGFINGSAGAVYNWAKSSMTVNYSVNIRDYDKWKRNSHAVYHSNTSSIARDGLGKNGPFGYDSHSISLNYSHMFDAQTHFSATWLNNIGKQFQTRKELISDSRTTSTIDRSSEATYDGYVPSLDLYVDHTFKNGDNLSVNVVGTLKQGESRRDLVDIENDEVSEVTNPIDNDRYSLISELFYTHPLNKNWTLSLGYQNTWSNTHNEYLAPLDFSTQMTENNNYMHASLSGNKGKWGYRFGIGMKAYFVNTDDGDQHYWKPKLSTSWMYYPTPKMNFQLSSSYSAEMPNLSEYTNVSQQVDDLMYMVGNPNIGETEYWNNNLSMHLQKNWFTTDLSMYYNRTFNPRYYDYTYVANEDYFLASRENADYMHTVGASWSSRMMGLWKFLNIYTTVRYNSYLSKGDDFSHHLDDLYWSLAFQMYYKNWTLAVSHKDSSKRLGVEQEFKYGANSAVSLQWKRKNVSLWASVTYLCNDKGWEYSSKSYNTAYTYNEDISIRDNSNMVTVGFRWNVHFGKQKRSPRKKLQNADYEQGILRVQK